MAGDVALLILRVVVGLALAAYGSQKLFGWFGGYGLSGFAGMLEQMNMRGARGWAVIGGLCEFIGGLLLVLGLLTPAGAVLILGSMLMAIVKWGWSQGYWSQNGGVELPLVYLVAAATTALTGPGPYSLDAAISLEWPVNYIFAGGAVAAIIVVAIGAALRTKHAGGQADAGQGT